MKGKVVTGTVAGWTTVNREGEWGRYCRTEADAKTQAIDYDTSDPSHGPRRVAAVVVPSKPRGKGRR